MFWVKNYNQLKDLNDLIKIKITELNQLKKMLIRSRNKIDLMNERKTNDKIKTQKVMSKE